MRVPLCLSLLVALRLALAAPATAEGPAHLVADLNPGLENSDPAHSFSSYTAVNGRVVFFGFLPEGIPELGQIQCGLWVVDAASGGGVEKLADLCNDDGDGRLGPWMLATTGAVAFLTDISGRLWRTDGTPAGTFQLRGAQGIQVALPILGFREALLGPDGHTLFFTGCGPAAGCQPWRSDGTRAGTRPLAALAPNATATDPALYTPFGGRVLFAFGNQLWSTDGSQAGTRLLVQVPGSILQKIVPQGSVIYLLIAAQGVDTVWRFDPGTRKLLKLASFFSDGRLNGATLRTAAGRVLILQFDYEDSVLRLWQTDGTPGGTRRLSPGFTSGADRFFGIGGRVIFAAGRGPDSSAPEQLWTLDPGSVKPSPLQGCAGGACPVVSDDLLASALFGGRLYFAGRDAQGACALWATDGTPRGTRRIQDLCPSQFRMALGKLIVIDSNGDLWTSDGTTAGTVHVTPTTFIPSSFTSFDLAESDGRIVFTGLDPQTGPQPFTSDLTPGGTKAIAMIGGLLAAGSDPFHLTPLGSRIVFNACDGHSGGLWTSDGSAAGTQKLPGTESDCASQPRILQRAGGLVFFQTFQPGSQLQRTDGTPAGTFPILPRLILAPAALGGKLLFITDPASFPPSTTGWPWDFWTSDGTSAGTRQIFSVRFGGTPDPIATAGGLGFFKATSPNDPFPTQIWRTDGTEAGTFPILDLLQSTDGRPVELAAIGERVYFTAYARSSSGGLESSG